jgi:hypothetical protein
MVTGGSAGSTSAEGGTGGTGVEIPPLPPGCPTPSPTPGPNAKIVIRSLNFGTSEIVLQNVSDEDQVILGGRGGWQWCNFPNYWNIILDYDGGGADVTLHPGQTYAFIPFNNQKGVNQMTNEGGELAIYTTTGAFTTASLMRAFVSWGTHVGDREATAVVAGYWTANDRIALAPSAVGFVITGESDRAGGYRAVSDARCLAAPPNP